MSGSHHITGVRVLTPEAGNRLPAFCWLTYFMIESDMGAGRSFPDCGTVAQRCELSRIDAEDIFHVAGRAVLEFRPQFR